MIIAYCWYSSRYSLTALNNNVIYTVRQITSQRLCNQWLFLGSHQTKCRTSHDFSAPVLAIFRVLKNTFQYFQELINTWNKLFSVHDRWTQHSHLLLLCVSSLVCFFHHHLCVCTQPLGTDTELPVPGHQSPPPARCLHTNSSIKWRQYRPQSLLH